MASRKEAAKVKNHPINPNGNHPVMESFRPTADASKVIAKAKEVTGKDKTALINGCLTKYLPKYAADLLSRRAELERSLKNLGKAA